MQTHIPASLKYGRAVTTTLPYAQAVDRAKALLKEEGFGVLCEIDVKKTMKEKIDAEVPPYVILGACNPRLAHRALAVENQIGLLLPCNLVVQELGNTTVVSAVDANAMMSFVGKAELGAVAVEANAGLGRVLDAIAKE